MFTQENDLATASEAITLQEVKLGNDLFYKITQVQKMRPFFMTIVSDSDHWLFVSSNGGISAGRKNAEYALFPYYTDDKITASAEHTGSKTILRIFLNGTWHVWEPFSIRSEAVYNCQRNLYKSRYGNKIIFEEINHDLAVTFTCEWNSSNRYGLVKKAALENHSANELQVQVADGLQNILPYGTGSDLVNSSSNLANAYKRSELLPETGLGIFALSAIIVDKAEPSEALKANTVWAAGLENPAYLLSVNQLSQFREGEPVQQETDVKGEQGAYFVCSETALAPGAKKNWVMVANVNQSQSAVIELSENIRHNRNLVNELLSDVETGTKNLKALVGAADGIQYAADELYNTRHYSNVLFNIMRGGIFDDHYEVSKTDFTQYVQRANADVFSRNRQLMAQLPEQFSVFVLKEMAAAAGDAHLVRLATEYLPLKFSRRHGDPSRPWNKFTINTRNETDGSKILDYEGNWRDIFQNWEALACSYPAFIEGMIYKFLNASTFDGYNPYRVTKNGFDWETIEPDNPWSYIGYWGDHQVIYLLKFLETAQQHFPRLVNEMMNSSCFVYAQVPYRIKPFLQILENPKDTIEFDHGADNLVRKRMAQLGADGALLQNQKAEVQQVTGAEKILALLLAKLTNLVPGGGIWMNTQRPEWNDANNALVGNGLSMVTLYYLRRFLVFIKPVLANAPQNGYALSAELHRYFVTVAGILEQYARLLPASLNNREKRTMLQELGVAAGAYREAIYTQAFSGDTTSVPAATIVSFVDNALLLIEYSIQQNKRSDGLYHTYNLLSYDEHQVQVTYLSEMLEGQVGVLSSGYLLPEESDRLLHALRNSALYRPDQDSYILYPNKDLPSFLEKNNIPPAAAQNIPLLQQLLAAGGEGIVERDIHGGIHFSGNFKNAADLDAALLQLNDKYSSLVKEQRTAVLALYEQVFNHKAFTGRSGTFFGYEGLGSVYWHMVSKLQLAVLETCLQAARQQADATILESLYEHYYQVRAGIGVHKPPVQYGAFPTDPYSHTPLGKGAQQPGMTGQVKEDILSRFGELGIVVHEGAISFKPVLLKKDQFVTTAKEVAFVNIKGEPQTIVLEPGSLFFTYCQVPVIYVLGEQEAIEITREDGTSLKTPSNTLTENESALVFQRTGEIAMIKVFIKASAIIS